MLTGNKLLWIDANKLPPLDLYFIDLLLRFTDFTLRFTDFTLRFTDFTLRFTDFTLRFTFTIIYYYNIKLQIKNKIFFPH